MQAAAGLRLAISPAVLAGTAFSPSLPEAWAAGDPLLTLALVAGALVFGVGLPMQLAETRRACRGALIPRVHGARRHVILNFLVAAPRPQRASRALGAHLRQSHRNALPEVRFLILTHIATPRRATRTVLEPWPASRLTQYWWWSWSPRHPRQWVSRRGGSLR